MKHELSAGRGPAGDSISGCPCLRQRSITRSVALLLAIPVAAGCHPVASVSYQVSPPAPSTGALLEAVDSLVSFVVARYELPPSDTRGLAARLRRRWEDGNLSGAP